MSSLMDTDIKRSPPVVGIFAIQGAVEEHANCVRKCGGLVKEVCNSLCIQYSLMSIHALVFVSTLNREKGEKEKEGE